MKDLFIHNRKTILYLIVITITQILLSSSLVGLVIYYHQDLQHANLINWLIIYAGFAILMAFSLLPNSFIAFLGGFFLDFYAMLLFLISYLFALAIGFMVASKIDNGNFSNSLQNYPKIKQFLEEVQHDDIKLVMLARFSPVFPFAAMNQILYSAGVQFKTYMWASVLGMLPRMLLMTYFGSQAADLRNFGTMTDNEKFTQIAFIIISAILFYMFMNKIMKKVNKTK